jgi:hypothetical protein
MINEEAPVNPEAFLFVNLTVLKRMVVGENNKTLSLIARYIMRS